MSAWPSSRSRPSSWSSTPIPAAWPSAADQYSAYLKAYACDPVSIFGGIVAVNTTLEARTAEDLSKLFLEVVIAPDATPEALAIFAKRKNVRVLLAGTLPDPLSPGMTMRSVAGGYLLQSRDNGHLGKSDLKVVTKRAPTAKELDDLLFAFTVCKHVKSNAIVYAKDGATVGVGAGQMNRRDSSRIAAIRAAESGEAGQAAAEPGDRQRRRLRRLLPLRRRPFGRGRSRRHGDHPAGRLDARQGSDRRGRREGAGDGLHRHAPLPPLAAETARQSRPRLS